MPSLVEQGRAFLQSPPVGRDRNGLLVSPETIHTLLSGVKLQKLVAYWNYSRRLALKQGETIILPNPRSAYRNWLYFFTESTSKDDELGPKQIVLNVLVGLYCNASRKCLRPPEHLY